MTTLNELIALLLAASITLSTITALQISGVYYDPVQADGERNFRYPL